MIAKLRAATVATGETKHATPDTKDIYVQATITNDAVFTVPRYESFYESFHESYSSHVKQMKSTTNNTMVRATKKEASAKLTPTTVTATTPEASAVAETIDAAV